VLRKQNLSIKRLQEIAVTIRDPRRQEYGNIRHLLVDILVISLLAIVCGCENWEEIRDYGLVKETWLKTFLALPHGIPSISTFQRMFRMIRTEELERWYREWVRPYVGSCLNKQICVDGKTVCGVGTQEDTKLHMVSAWIREDKITFGQIKTSEKSNEITAIPELLEALEIEGGIVTIDAMGCQKKIAQTIRGKEAHYVLAVKGNQETLLNEVREYFEWALTDPIEQYVLDEYRCSSYEHGRISHWKVVTTEETGWFESKHEWKDLRTFVMVERMRTVDEKKTIERAFFISSLQADAKYLHELVRGHWGIENSLHWVLDVQFHEDACMIHKGNAPENLSLLRKIAMALLKRVKTPQVSYRRLQKRAGWDNQFASLIIS